MLICEFYSFCFRMIFALSSGVYIIGVSSLRLTNISVPSTASVRDSLWLNCSYDLEQDQLYSIKWYKDSEEIYRFLPSADPPITTYDMNGLNLNLSKSNYGNVLVMISDTRSQGDYRCEVSAEAPSFQTVKETRTMKVYPWGTLPPRNAGTTRSADQLNTSRRLHPLQNFSYASYLLVALIVSCPYSILVKLLQ